MGIKFSPCYGKRELFLKLAKDYVEELSAYDNTIRWDESAADVWMWDAEFILENNKIRGFIFSEIPLVGEDKPYLYIAEFYIVPEARKRGLGFEAVKAFMKRWDGDVFLYILNRNKPAKGFWTAVEQRLGWKRILEPEIRQERGCELRIFKQERESEDVSSGNEAE